jgi:asparagine synthetase B (glutamine-hydrolysing)
VPEHKLAETWRSVLLERTSGDASCAVLLSHGVDSNAVLAALLRNCRKPAVVSFRRADTMSRDWRAARATARHHNLPFHDVVLPISPTRIERDVRFAIGLGFRGKADVECGNAWIHAVRAIAALGIKEVYSGYGVDKKFGLSKAAQMDAHNGKGDDADWLDEYRRENEKSQQLELVTAYAKTLGVDFIAPCRDERLMESVMGWSWNALNKPRQKEPLRDAFPEMKEWNVANVHVNFNRGDSGIAEMYEVLLDGSLNVGGWKSPVGIYNAIAKGKL